MDEHNSVHVFENEPESSTVTEMIKNISQIRANTNEITANHKELNSLMGDIRMNCRR
jgi:hypothetical protein